jgi:hypothetical protein
VHSGNIRVAEIVVQPERRVGWHGYVVIHGIGSVAADADGRQFALRIDSADVHAIAGFANFDLDFLREVLGVSVVAILNVDFRGDFQFMTGIAMDVDLSEAVIETKSLIARKRYSFFEVARDLLLPRLRGESGTVDAEKQNGAKEPRWVAVRLLE